MFCSRPSSSFWMAVYLLGGWFCESLVSCHLRLRPGTYVTADDVKGDQLFDNTTLLRCDSITIFQFSNESEIIAGIAIHCYVNISAHEIYPLQTLLFTSIELKL